MATAAGAALLSAAVALGAHQWTEAPAFVELFAPAAHRGAYRAAVSPEGIDAVLAALADDPALVRTPGAWTPQRAAPADAFGRSGSYDRWRLARLYGARQARVARGARMEAGRVIESWLMVSPYPSPDLTRLEPGTLLIVLRMAS